MGFDAQRKQTNKTSKKGGTVTQNQIEYFKASEGARHNAETEQETKRYNTYYLNELNRSNIAKEQEQRRYNTLYLQEQQRSNLERERISLLNLQEQVRSNLTRESQNQRQLDINERSNLIQLEKINNDYLLGTGNLFETSRINTSRIDYTKKQQDLVGAQTSNTVADTSLKKSQQFLNYKNAVLVGAKTKTENELRQPTKTKTIADTFGVGVSQALKAVRLFSGGK